MMLRWATLSLLFALIAAALASTPEDAAWLEANKENEGVVVLPSGLQYKVLNSGDPSGPSPGPSTPCKVHYRGTLINGEEFDSSYKRGQPATFSPNQVIKGWTEALQLMHEGDKWQLFIPSELAYGDSRRGKYIYPGAVLIFDVEIVEVIGRGGEL